MFDKILACFWASFNEQAAPSLVGFKVESIINIDWISRPNFNKEEIPGTLENVFIQKLILAKLRMVQIRHWQKGVC